MELGWRIHWNLAAIHAAWCIARWPEDDLKVPTEFRAKAAALISVSNELKEQKDRFWDSLLRLAPDFEDGGDLASRIGEEFPCITDVTDDLVQPILDVQQSFRSCYPNFESEVRLRMNPIREHWEGYGPGLLHSMSKLAGVAKSAERCEIFSVLPHRGGVGYAHPGNNRLHLELLLTNRHPRIPETLFLAWLIAQTQYQAAIHRNGASSDRGRWIAQLGWLPVTFAAAENLEVSELNPSLVAKAIELWWVGHNCASEQLADHLVQWWQSPTLSSVGWNDRLATLDLRLAEISQSDRQNG